VEEPFDCVGTAAQGITYVNPFKQHTEDANHVPLAATGFSKAGTSDSNEFMTRSES